ncbi:MAG: ATP-binding protein [Xenococcaceae cyanobacterium MO_167.B52]|nr:ATP-binding protein [Xenococcaceae cyanobacterium MO_167.B52]
MIVSPLDHWLEANQRYLMAALAEVRQMLEQRVGASGDRSETMSSQDLESMRAAMKVAPAIETLCQLFNLSPFERQVLLLCAGVELDGEIAKLCGQIQGDNRKNHATFSLALAVLPNSHWSAIYPASSLRHWRLLELGNSDGIIRSPLRIDERVLHYLTGGQDLDQRLVGLVRSVSVSRQLVPSHQILAERLAANWSGQPNQRLAVVQLCGTDPESQREIASAACTLLGLKLQAMSARLLPVDARELEVLMRLWEREAALNNSLLLLDCQELNTSDAARQDTIQRFIEGLRVGLIVSTRERKTWGECPTLTLEVQPPTTEEQYELWHRGLGQVMESNGSVSALVGQYNFNSSTIQAVCAEALGQLEVREQGSQVLIQHQISPNPPYQQGGNSKIQNLVWDICRSQSCPRLSDLAQRIEPTATWDDLVLPPMEQQVLQEIAVHVRQRLTVYETWGFASKGARGLGISALFAGLSGTGKTMAAEVLANELRLELYRIDLSSVVSKYIGETEKNLRRVFDAAEQGGAILLFDEADALFGKRSEVKDSHDRYANIEVSYLLQRMEAYRGLAILTTNLKNALDTAFMRRLRFIVQFPFPDMAQRAEIWQRIFPAATPTEGLDVQKLARLNIAGGNIRNIALYAAFLAAEAQEPVQMSHLLRAAQVEFVKFEKSLTESEIRGWV